MSASVIVCDPFSTIVEMEIDQQLEQRINIKFLVKLGKIGPKICQVLQQAYGEDALKGCSVIEKAEKIPWTTKGQGAFPLRAAMKTSIECIFLCLVTAR
jgi:hypothetical protein